MDNVRSNQDLGHSHEDRFDAVHDYERAVMLNQDEPLVSKLVDEQVNNMQDRSEQMIDKKSIHIESSYKDIPERVFMNGLIKHTGIALAIIIPLAAFSAYAATPPTDMVVAKNKQASNMPSNTTNDKTTTEMLPVKPSDILHKSVG